MKALVIAFAGLALATPALAGSYRVVLEPVDGKMLVGHAGVQAVDETTATAHVRLISPGNRVAERGSVRVLVKNLGSAPFSFGPSDVKLVLADGTELKPTPLDKFAKGAELIQREVNHAAAIDMQVKNSLSSYAQQSGGGTMQASPGGGALAPVSTPTDVQDLQRRTDESDLPGGKTMEALYQVLLPESVGPQQAWGGYYVFELPKQVFLRKADQPLTVLVRTGAEEHRFAATLHWK
jgi:hypothetical protein